MSEDDRSALVIGTMDLSDALEQVQWALLRIGSRMKQQGVRLDSADLSLETVREVNAKGEVTILVVTVAGSLATKATNTLIISLREPTAKQDEKFKLQAEVQDDLVDLSNAMFEVLEEAGSSPTIPLELKNGSVKVELIVDATGSLKVSGPKLLREILRNLGLGASFEVSSNWVSTSSITLNFGNVADESA